MFWVKIKWMNVMLNSNGRWKKAWVRGDRLQRKVVGTGYSWSGVKWGWYEVNGAGCRGRGRRQAEERGGTVRGGGHKLQWEALLCPFMLSMSQACIIRSTSLSLRIVVISYDSMLLSIGSWLVSNAFLINIPEAGNRYLTAFISVLRCAWIREQRCTQTRLRILYVPSIRLFFHWTFWKTFSW